MLPFRGGRRMRQRHIALCLGLIGTVFAPEYAQTQPAQPPPDAPPASYTPPLPSADYPYPNAGARIGQGWDSFNERATGASCVDVVEAPLEKASFETHVEQIQSTYSLATQTTTSVSASYSGFGASASGGFSMS